MGGGGEREREPLCKYAPDGYGIESIKVCLLRKSLYELRVCPRDWSICFLDFITKAYFRRSEYAL